MIIDSHLHLSITGDKEKSFNDVKENLIFDMEENGVSHCIVIPDNISGTNCADMAEVQKAIAGDERFFMMATLKIGEIENKISEMENLFKRRSVVGFKTFPGHDPIYPTDKRWLPIYDLCEKCNIPLVIHTGINSNDEKASGYNDPKYIIQIAQKYENLKIVIAHYFWPKLDYCYETTNGFDNIYFDTSALADQEVIEKSGGIDKIKEILVKTVKRNPKSVLSATDWPMAKISDHIALIKSLPISDMEKDNIFYKNAINLYSLPISNKP